MRLGERMKRRRLRALHATGKAMGMPAHIVDEHLTGVDLGSRRGFVAARAAMCRDLRVRLGGWAA